MSNEILEKLIKSYMNTNQNKQYAFGWQGGEHTLMGLNFFKKAPQKPILHFALLVLWFHLLIHHLHSFLQNQP